MKVILPVGEIPLNSTVTKITGDAKYLVVDSIKIHGDSTQKEIKAQEGTRFLISEKSYILCLTEYHQVVWEVEPATLYHWLYRKMNGVPQ